MAIEPLTDGLRYEDDFPNSGRKILPIILAVGIGASAGAAIEFGVFDGDWRADANKALTAAEVKRGAIKKESTNTVDGKNKVEQLIAGCDGEILSCMGAQDTDFSSLTVHCLSENNATRCVFDHIQNRAEAKAFIDCVKNEVMSCYEGR